MRHLILTCSIFALLVLGTACTEPSSDSEEGDGLHSMVPSVMGLEEAVARSALEDAGYVVGEVTTQPAADAQPGTVIDQSPIPSTSAPRQSEVDLVIAGP